MSLQFVRSHQDDDKLFSQFSLASRLNAPMDHSAKEASSNQSKPSIQQKNLIPHLPQQNNSFFNQHCRLTRNTLKELNRYKVGLAVEGRIQQKYKLIELQMNNINWNDFESVIGSASISTRTHFIKKIITLGQRCPAISNESNQKRIHAHYAKNMKKQQIMCTSVAVNVQNPVDPFKF